MMIPEVQQSRDYNRGLPAPIRWAHVFGAFVRWLSTPIRRWATQPGRRPWAVPILWGLAIACLIGLADGLLVRGIRVGSLWRPDLSGVLSWGVVVVSLLVASVVWIQDPPRRGRILDWAAGFVIALATCRFVSMFVTGRPRPKFDDPGYFINILGAYPIGPELGIRHPWEFWAKGVSGLWSMPSIEAAYAALGASIVSAVYPNLRFLAWPVAAFACLGVVLTGLGYPSDAAVGAAIGIAAARTSLARRWGGTLRQLGRL